MKKIPYTPVVLRLFFLIFGLMAYVKIGAVNKQFVLDEIFRGNGVEWLEIETLDSLVNGKVLSLDDEVKISLLTRQIDAYLSV